jgi:hypothetical protein
MPIKIWLNIWMSARLITLTVICLPMLINKINLLDGNDNFYKDNGISTDNIVALGLVYQF